jgi:hypothetical protein
VAFNWYENNWHQLGNDGKSEGYISSKPFCISNFAALYLAYELANEPYLIEDKDKGKDIPVTGRGGP